MKHTIIALMAVLVLAGQSLAAGRYRASLSQVGTAAPTAVVFENTLGGTPTFERLNPGLYRLILADAFPDDTKIFGLRKTILNSSTGTTLHWMRIAWDDEYDPGSSLIIQTYDMNMATGVEVSTDERLNRTDFAITVYP